MYNIPGIFIACNNQRKFHVKKNGKNLAQAINTHKCF